MDYILELQKFFGCDKYDLENAHNTGVMPFPGLATLTYDTITETDELISACQIIDGFPICGFYSTFFHTSDDDVYMIIPYLPFCAYEGKTYDERIENAYHKITSTGQVFCLIADLNDPYDSYFEECVFINGEFARFDGEDEAMSSKLTSEYRRGRRLILQKVDALDQLHKYVENYGELTSYGVIKGVFQFDMETGFIEMIRDDEKCFDWPKPLQFCGKIA